MTRSVRSSGRPGLLFVAVLALLGLRPAAAEGPADGHWIAAKLAAPGVYWVESIEFKGTVFTSRIHGFGRNCHGRPANDKERLHNRTLACRGVLTAFTGTVAAEEGGRRGRVRRLVATDEPFDDDADLARAMALSLMSGSVRWSFEREDDHLVLRSGSQSRRFVRMPAEDAIALTWTMAVAAPQIRDTATVPEDRVAIESLFWPCVVTAASRAGTLRDRLLGAGRFARWYAETIEIPKLAVDQSVAGARPADRAEDERLDRLAASVAAFRRRFAEGKAVDEAAVGRLMGALVSADDLRAANELDARLASGAERPSLVLCGTAKP